jgi:hypothetical protein
MSAETALRAALLAAPSVTAMVGQRVVADRAEQGAPLPFAVFTRTATDPYTTIDGALLGARTGIELQCWAESRAGAEALADACQSVIRSAGQLVVNRSASTDPNLDLQAAVLAVEWFETT